MKRLIALSFAALAAALTLFAGGHTSATAGSDAAPVVAFDPWCC